MTVTAAAATNFENNFRESMPLLLCTYSHSLVPMQDKIWKWPWNEAGILMHHHFENASYVAKDGCKMYRKLPSLHPPFCTLLWIKRGEGVFARIFNLSRVYPSSMRGQRYCWWLWRTATSQVMYHGMSAVARDTKPRGSEVTCIVGCDRRWPAYVCTASDKIWAVVWKGG